MAAAGGAARRPATGSRMPNELKKVLKAFCLEAPIYAVVAGVYLKLVIRYLGTWLTRMFHDDKVIYAVAALGLIVAQGCLLEIAARALLALTKDRTPK